MQIVRMLFVLCWMQLSSVLLFWNPKTLLKILALCWIVMSIYKSMYRRSVDFLMQIWNIRINLGSCHVSKLSRNYWLWLYLDLCFLTSKRLKVQFFVYMLHLLSNIFVFLCVFVDCVLYLYPLGSENEKTDINWYKGCRCRTSTE